MLVRRGAFIWKPQVATQQLRSHSQAASGWIGQLGGPIPVPGQKAGPALPEMPAHPVRRGGMGKAPKWPGLHPVFDSQVAETNHRMTVGRRGHTGCLGNMPVHLWKCPTVFQLKAINIPAGTPALSFPHPPQEGCPCLIHHANQPAFGSSSSLHSDAYSCIGSKPPLNYQALFD